MNNLNKIAGIDYSISSPAMCICTGDFKFENLQFFYVSEKKRWNNAQFLSGQIEGFKALDKEQFLDIDRITHLSTIFTDCIFDIIQDGEQVEIGVEDYAFAANGNITLLAESMGILKYKLRTDNHNVKPYAPTTIKKFARNVYPIDKQRKSDGKLIKMDKVAMYDAFVYDTGIDLLKEFGLTQLVTKSGTPTMGNPITDIVDAYFIAKYHYENTMKG